MWRRILNASIIAATLATGPLRAAPPPVDPVTGHWTLEVALGECVLLRSLAPDKPILRLETSTGSDSYTFAVTDDRLRRMRTGSPPVEAAEIRVDGQRRGNSYASIARDYESFPVAAVMAGVDKQVVDAIGLGSSLSIKIAGREIVALALPEAAKALASLHRCEAEQLIEWGADPGQFAPGGTRPEVRDRDMLVPQLLLKKVRYPRQLGPFPHYLVLSEAGVVERCASVYGSADSNMEQIVCGYLMGRKVAKPALDPSGKAVRGVIAIEPAMIITVITRG